MIICSFHMHTQKTLLQLVEFIQRYCVHGIECRVSLQFQTAKTALFSLIETYLQLTTIIPPLPNIARNIS